MDQFKIKNVGDVIIVKTELIAVNYRDAQPFWDFLDVNSIFDWDKIIIDISGCYYIDSTIIGVIVKTFRKVSAKSGKINLVFPQRSGADAMKYLSITKIVDCYDTLREALDGFNSKLPTRDFTFDKDFSLN